MLLVTLSVSQYLILEFLGLSIVVIQLEYLVGLSNDPCTVGSFGYDFGIDLLLDAEVFDYSDESDTEGFLIVISHPKDYPIIAKDGFLVAPG